LDVSVPFFFEDMPPEISGESVPDLAEDKKEGPDPLARPETLKLVRAYYRIKDPNVRNRLYNLFKSLSGAYGA